MHINKSHCATTFRLPVAARQHTPVALASARQNAFAGTWAVALGRTQTTCESPYAQWVVSIAGGLARSTGPTEDCYEPRHASSAAIGQVATQEGSSDVQSSTRSSISPKLGVSLFWAKRQTSSTSAPLLDWIARLLTWTWEGAYRTSGLLDPGCSWRRSKDLVDANGSTPGDVRSTRSALSDASSSERSAAQVRRVKQLRVLTPTASCALMRGRGNPTDPLRWSWTLIRHWRWKQRSHVTELEMRLRW